MNEFILFLRVFLTPGLWIRNHKTNKYWDKILRSLIESNAPIKHAGSYHISISEYCIWIENKWYDYGDSYNNDKIPNNILPSRRTAILLSDYLKNGSNSAVPVWFSDFEIKRSPLAKALTELDTDL